MTEKHTLIKEIGDERILLGDTYTSNPTIIFYLFGVVIFICTTLLLFKSFEYHNPGIITWVKGSGKPPVLTVGMNRNPF
jgi:hypothetical protein